MSPGMQVRTIGVEEELLLVDADRGTARAVATAALQDAADRDADGDQDDADGPGGTLAPELQQQQIEIDTHPQTDVAAVLDELREWRRRADEAALVGGARVAALATSPLPVDPETTTFARFDRMVERFGLTTTEQLACGLHVHVSVESDDEGVAALDRIRIWLPSLLALSANSPFWQGKDSGYASFRSQSIDRWPSAGPTDLFGSPDAYHDLIAEMVASGVLLDEAMVYFDARLSSRYPTIEIRVADVCLEVEDSVLIAALARGLVETAAREWEMGEQAPAVPSQLVRLAVWQAGRSGVSDQLVDPRTFRPRAARQVIDDLVEHIRPALKDSGDETWVTDAVERVFARGTGSQRQRAALEGDGDLGAVVRDAIEATHGG